MSNVRWRAGTTRGARWPAATAGRRQRPPGRRWRSSSSPCCPASRAIGSRPFAVELAALESELLEALARAALLGGDREQLAAAERAARTLVDRNQFRESCYGLLIEVQARLGNVAEATLTFDRVRVLLRDELGTAPSAGLSALHEQLLRSGRLTADPLPDCRGRATRRRRRGAAGHRRHGDLDAVRRPRGGARAPARALARGRRRRAPLRAADGRARRRQDTARRAVRRRGPRRRRDGALRPLRRGAAARLPAVRRGAAPLRCASATGSPTLRASPTCASSRGCCRRCARPTARPPSRSRRTPAASATCCSRPSRG